MWSGAARRGSDLSLRTRGGARTHRAGTPAGARSRARGRPPKTRVASHAQCRPVAPSIDPSHVQRGRRVMPYPTTRAPSPNPAPSTRPGTTQLSMRGMSASHSLGSIVLSSPSPRTMAVPPPRAVTPRKNSREIVAFTVAGRRVPLCAISDVTSASAHAPFRRSQHLPARKKGQRRRSHLPATVPATPARPLRTLVPDGGGRVRGASGGTVRGSLLRDVAAAGG
jgi:hypothetical protein